MLELLAGVLSVIVLISSVIVVFGCLCIRKPPGFSSFENEYDVEAHHGSFNLEPANVSFHEDNAANCVLFEPLPDILSKTVSATAMRPRITLLEKDKSESLLKLSGIQHQGFPRAQLIYIKELGQGWFGQVLEGDADKISIGSKKAKVVVKLLKDDAAGVEQKQFLEEVSPYRDLSHPNILSLLGQCTEIAPMLVLLEFSPFGDLKSFLLNERDDITENKQLVKYILDAAAGLSCLHRHNYVHHDFAARNCLLFPDSTVKIGDYGLSEDKYKEDYYDTGRDLLPVRWMAPESVVQENKVWTAKKFTKEGNIWSFGVTMWEILAFGEKPYKYLNDEEVIMNVIDKQVLKLLPVLTQNVDNSRLINIYHNNPESLRNENSSVLSKYAHCHKVQAITQYSIKSAEENGYGRWTWSCGSSTCLIFQMMQICWLNIEQRPSIEELHRLLWEVYEKDGGQDNSRFDKKWNSLLPNEIKALQTQLNKQSTSDFKPLEVSSPIIDQVSSSIKTTITASPITPAYSRSNDSFSDECTSPVISCDTPISQEKTFQLKNKILTKNNLIPYPSLAQGDKISAESSSCEASWVKVSPMRENEVVSPDRTHPESTNSFENITLNPEAFGRPPLSDNVTENKNLYTVKFVSDVNKSQKEVASHDGMKVAANIDDRVSKTSEGWNEDKDVNQHRFSDGVGEENDQSKQSVENNLAGPFLNGACSEQVKLESSDVSIETETDLNFLDGVLKQQSIIGLTDAFENLDSQIEEDSVFSSQEESACIDKNTSSHENIQPKHIHTTSIESDEDRSESDIDTANKTDGLDSKSLECEDCPNSETFHSDCNEDVGAVLEQVSCKLDQLSVKSNTDSDITTGSEESDLVSSENETQGKSEKESKNLSGISDIYMSKGLLGENKFSPNTSNRQLDTIPEISPETDSSASDGVISDKVSEDPPSDIPFDSLSFNNETFEWDDDFEGQLYSKVRPDSFLAHANVSDWEFDTSDIRNKSMLAESRLGSCVSEPRLSDSNESAVQRHLGDGSLRLSCGSTTSEIVNKLSLSSMKSRPSASRFYALGMEYDGFPSKSQVQKDDFEKRARKSDSEYQESDSVFIPSSENVDFSM